MRTDTHPKWCPISYFHEFPPSSPFVPSSIKAEARNLLRRRGVRRRRRGPNVGTGQSAAETDLGSRWFRHSTEQKNIEEKWMSFSSLES